MNKQNNQSLEKHTSSIFKRFGLILHIPKRGRKQKDVNSK